MLFHFTGTGNRLYAAKRLEETPLSIPQVTRGAQLDFSAEQIGVVAPIYGHEVPPMVKEFLRKARFHTNYFYMVLTYGNRHGGAAELACAHLCPEKAVQLNVPEKNPNARYRNPHITVSEIIQANNQNRTGQSKTGGQ